MNRLETLKRWVSESEKIVFFGGAGVSTESGIPDFRSVDGLYSQKFDYPPETIISHSFFAKRPEDFFRFYREKMLPLGFEPNITHRVLAQWEREGRLSAIVTQNIDGLHQKAGSQKVFELHGSIHRNYCMRCGKFFSAEDIQNSSGVPHCEDGVPHCGCGGMIKPDVVLYNESLDGDTIEGAVNAIAEADMLVIGGTSLNVYPAAGFLDYFRGKHLVLINKSATPRDAEADLIFRDPIGQLLGSME